LLTTPPGNLGLSGKSMLLFAGTDSPGASLTFVSPWTDFGFYLATEDPTNPGNVLRAFFSESTLNSGTESGKDYQDLVVYVANVPDASTLDAVPERDACTRAVAPQARVG
jgi:hypothetical protein